MTYEEKFKLVVEAINRLTATKKSNEAAYIKLYPSIENKLASITMLDIFTTLIDLQREYGFAINVNSSPFNTLPYSRPDPNQKYFELYFYDGVFQIDVDYLEHVGDALEKLSYINFLKIYDVLLEIEEEHELTRKDHFIFSYPPKSVRFPEIYSSNSELAYIASRDKAIEFLFKNGVIGKQHIAFGEPEQEKTLEISLGRIKKFKRYLKKAKDMYQNYKQTSAILPERILTRKIESPSTNSVQSFSLLTLIPNKKANKKDRRILKTLIDKEKVEKYIIAQILVRIRNDKLRKNDYSPSKHDEKINYHVKKINQFIKQQNYKIREKGNNLLLVKEGH
jgi:hypothetical protein